MSCEFVYIPPPPPKVLGPNIRRNPSRQCRKIFTNDSSDDLEYFEDLESDDYRKSCGKRCSKKKEVSIGDNGKKCFICKKLFSGLTALRFHMKSHKSKRGEYICCICGNKYKDSRTAKRHMDSHYDNRRFKCVICKKEFLQKDHLLKHLRYHVGSVSLKKAAKSESTSWLDESSCNSDIKAVFNDSDPKNVQSFVINDDGNKWDNFSPAEDYNEQKKDMKCCICNEVFMGLKAYQFHLKSHRTKNGYGCPICKKNIQELRDMKRHILTHSEDYNKHRKTDMKCYICNEVFMGMKAYQFHVKSHRTENGYSCPICKKNMVHICSMKKHILNHSEDHINKQKKKNVKCFICNEVFEVFVGSNSKAYRLHMKSHQTENGYSCPICKENVEHFGSLKNHILNHSDKKPYQCTECEESFIRKSYLTKHILSHSDKNPYKCTECKKRSFARKCDLTKHRLKAHSISRKNSLSKALFFKALRNNKSYDNEDHLVNKNEPDAYDLVDAETTSEISNCDIDENEYNSSDMEDEEMSEISDHAPSEKEPDNKNTETIFETSKCCTNKNESDSSDVEDEIIKNSKMPHHCTNEESDSSGFHSQSSLESDNGVEVKNDLEFDDFLDDLTDRDSSDFSEDFSEVYAELEAALCCRSTKFQCSEVGVDGTVRLCNNVDPLETV